MTIWSVLPFDNSRGSAWVYALSETSDLTLIASTLGRLEGQEVIRLDQGVICEAIAACEVVARLNGNRQESNEFTDLVDHWIARRSIAASSGLTARARAVLARLLDLEPDLSSLSQSISSADWRVALISLDNRLARSG